MRVFYDDETESNPLRNYYVKIDNINVPESLKGYKAIEATNVDEIIKKVREIYNFKEKQDIIIQLWTQQNCLGTRLDNMTEIPKGIEFIWIRAISNKPRD